MSTKRVYKFYSAESALRNLKQKRLKISQLEELNDPFEMNPFAINDNKSRNLWKKLQRKIWANKGIISFSDRWSNPVIWSHYSDNHRGLCLGVDLQEDLIFPVTYSGRRELLPSLGDLEKLQKDRVFERSILTKYSHWKYENEWRAILSIDPSEAEDGMFFEPFSEKIQLKEVIIGARSEIRSADLKKIVSPDVKIITARLAFKSFRVVSQNNRDLRK